MLDEARVLTSSCCPKPRLTKTSSSLTLAPTANPSTFLTCLLHTDTQTRPLESSSSNDATVTLSPLLVVTFLYWGFATTVPVSDRTAIPSHKSPMRRKLRGRLDTSMEEAASACTSSAPS